MNTCQTCRFWTRQPDKVFQPTEYQKPVGEPQVTRYGACSKLYVSSHLPDETMIAVDPGHGELDDAVLTGPRFGCVHYMPIP